VPEPGAADQPKKPTLEESAFLFHGGQTPIPFLSTHPLNDRRIAEIESLLPQALAEYRKSAK
jgi:predicted Zn-dependent protease